jgi:multimeric flavodoxin WrbA
MSDTATTDDLTCVALNCTLKAEGESSTQLMLEQITEQLATHGVSSHIVRVAAHQVLPGTSAEPQGPGDDWPSIREQILEADIVLLGTPVWLGNPSSICRRVLERMDAFISETDEEGRMALAGKVGGVAVVGNEDGAHHTTAQCYQGLIDLGVSVPYNGATYWVGEAMGATDYKDLEETPESVGSTMTMMATNLAHLARVLRDNPFPPPGR